VKSNPRSIREPDIPRKKFGRGGFQENKERGEGDLKGARGWLKATRRKTECETEDLFKGGGRKEGQTDATSCV